jgi:predicted 3-demethylubiquinone-9 3-methyltransferase (glyoxalase superfamily)
MTEEELRVKNISTCLWFNDGAEEALELYSSVFKNVKKLRSTKYSEASANMSGRPKGSLMTLEFEIEGQVFMGLNGGPAFQINPSISFYVSCGSEEEVEARFNKLSPGGRVLMPLDKYPFSEKYCWVIDKFGVSWQLNLTENPQPIVPAMMFVGQQNGCAEVAMKYYASIFDNSKILEIHRYGAGEGDTEGHIKHAKFSLNGETFIAFDSGLAHSFDFNEGVSFIVDCKIQEEVDYFWYCLSWGGQQGQCGWLKDRFGVSWQIVPTVLAEMLQDNDAARYESVINALMQMTKLDIAGLQAAHQK